MDNKSLKCILVNEFDYPSFMVDGVIEKINGFSKELLKAFEVFLTSGTLPEITYKGYTVRKLIDEMDMVAVGAFLTMDALMKDPEETMKMLEYGIR